MFPDLVFILSGFYYFADCKELDELKVRNAFFRSLKYIPLEALMWMIALVLLMVNDPGNDTGFSLCPFHNLGLDFCPGCGLGTSISYAFRGQWEASLNAHPLGMIAIIILTSRIFALFRNFYKEFFNKRNKAHGKCFTNIT